MDTLICYIQEIDYISLALFCVPIFTVITCGILLFSSSRCDTMQRKNSEACHSSSKSYNNYNKNPDSRMLTDNYYNFYKTISSLSLKKSQSKLKHKDNKNSSSTLRNTNGQKLTDSSRFVINAWLQKDLHCYESSIESSGTEDHIVSCRNPIHRNSTSSEAAGSDDLNSSCSNDNLCITYLFQKKSPKEVTKTRQKKQQKHKQITAYSNVNNINRKSQQMGIDKEIKKNVKTNIGKQTSRNAALNLRKQCTKTAALKAVFNNFNMPKTSFHSQNALAPESSVYSSLSSASSTTSINSSISSSTSSSPIHSANSSPTASPVSKRNTEHIKKSARRLTPPLKQFIKLSMNEQQLVEQMRRYVIEPDLLRVYGFPVESIHYEGCVEIYKCLPKHLAEEAVTVDNQRHHRHFYGRKKFDVVNIHDGLYSSFYNQQWYYSNLVDSGHGSGESSPRFIDSDSSEMGEDDLITPVMAFYTPDGVYQIFSEYCNSTEKQCVRCSKMFQVSEEGEYLSFDPCIYHWGKLSNVYNGKCYVNIYSCCQGDELSEGCSNHILHVWNGTVVGINGPYADFAHTKHKKIKKHNSKIYAIDCEMSYTGLGLEVTKVTVVGYDGSLVYENFVQPQAEIVDYNTRFSGVSEKDFSSESNNSVKTFFEVQADLLNLFDADTVLIGHSLDNDLRVLRLVHKNIVDTSVIFKHSTGYPYRRSLKNLTKAFLKRDIQCGDSGHSSFEDSRACLELMMWKIRKDLRHWNYQ